jgi:hypothetical protein
MRFLLDGMLGKLTRWLRILGYDAEYSKNSSDNNLLSQAKDESRILLTSDAQLYRNAVSRNIDTLLMDSKSDSEKLANLAYRFHLNLKLDPMNSRCPICGSSIKPTSKDEIVHSVPPATFKVYQSFWVCTNVSCAKVYWQGSHWKKIEETLRNASEILDRKQQQTQTRTVSLP